MAVKTNRLKATPVLRERIREVGLRQNWLADRVGVSEATLSLVIAGKRGLTQQRAWQLAALVDNDVALLFELSKDGRKLSKSSRRA
jgi:plasmid maintenance system antidote protein VapI